MADLGSIEDREPRRLTDELDDRPERDAVPVGEASPAQDGGSGLDLRGELFDQPRLPGSRRPQDREEMTGAVRRHPLERLSKQRQLAVPADDRRVESPVVAGGAGRDVLESIRGDRLLLALGRDRLRRLRPDRVTGQSEGLRADEDLAGSGRLLETGRGVDGIPGHQHLSGRGIARDDLARVHADPRRERDAAVALEFLVEVLQPVAHLHRGPNRAKGIVLMHVRDPEDRHHRISDELLHGAAMTFDRDLHRVEVPRHHAPEGLGVEQLTERRGAGDVAEHHGDRLAHLVASGAGSVSGEAHAMQNRASSGFSAPQLGQARMTASLVRPVTRP